MQYQMIQGPVLVPGSVVTTLHCEKRGTSRMKRRNRSSPYWNTETTAVILLQWDWSISILTLVSILSILESIRPVLVFPNLPFRIMTGDNKRSQSKSARLALGCHFRANVSFMHRSRSWAKVSLQPSLEFTANVDFTPNFWPFLQLLPTSNRCVFFTFTLPLPRTHVLRFCTDMSHFILISIGDHDRFKKNL